YVMWPLTPAGRRVLAWRARTYCLRRIRAPRPLRHLDFRGSTSNPTRLRCTLRRGRHLPRRNTRYRAGATPHPGRTPSGWNTLAFLAHEPGRALLPPITQEAVLVDLRSLLGLSFILLCYTRLQN